MVKTSYRMLHHVHPFHRRYVDSASAITRATQPNLVIAMPRPFPLGHTPASARVESYDPSTGLGFACGRDIVVQIGPEGARNFEVM